MPERERSTEELAEHTARARRRQDAQLEQFAKDREAISRLQQDRHLERLAIAESIPHDLAPPAIASERAGIGFQAFLTAAKTNDAPTFDKGYRQLLANIRRIDLKRVRDASAFDLDNIAAAFLCDLFTLEGSVRAATLRNWLGVRHAVFRFLVQPPPIKRSDDSEGPNDWLDRLRRILWKKVGRIVRHDDAFAKEQAGRTERYLLRGAPASKAWMDHAEIAEKLPVVASVLRSTQDRDPPVAHGKDVRAHILRVLDVSQNQPHQRWALTRHTWEKLHPKPADPFVLLEDREGGNAADDAPAPSSEGIPDPYEASEEREWGERVDFIAAAFLRELKPTRVIKGVALKLEGRPVKEILAELDIKQATFYGDQSRFAEAFQARCREEELGHAHEQQLRERVEEKLRRGEFFPVDEATP